MRKAILTLLMIAIPLPLLAQQDGGAGDIVVTGTRRNSGYYGSNAPVIRIKRQADFALQQVKIEGDTRDTIKRHDEIYATVRNAIVAAQKQAGIELATGEVIVQSITLDNYKSLPLKKDDDRNDTDSITLLVKVRLDSSGNAKEALDRIAKFVKNIQPVGRALADTEGDLILGLAKPEQYRGQILDAIATETRAMTAKFGADYAANIDGADKKVEWSRASLTELFLFLPYSISIVPKR